jgi:LmbE family N-acetylglucosaminyl deacetylase
MTNGDGFTFAAKEQFHRLFLKSDDYIRSGYARQVETVNALRYLGVPDDHIIFLGYPDRGLKAVWADNWESNQPYRSRYTESDHSPYNNSYQQHVPYAGEAVLAGLEQIIHDFKPTLILSPHPADEHADHAATWAFVAASYIKLQNSEVLPRPELYTYLVHRGDFPIPHGYKAGEFLLPPRPLQLGKNNQWYTYPLSIDNENSKEQALKEYVSQLRVPIMSKLLYSFIRKNELLEKIQIPVIMHEPSDVDLSILGSWQKHAPFLVNPPGVNPLGALEPRAKIATIAGAIQNDAVWLRFHIPEFAGKKMRYQVTIVEFYREQQALRREKKSFYFSSADTDLPLEDIRRFPDDVVIKLSSIEQGLPDCFFIRVTTEDIFGAVSNRTVWQPALIKQFSH